MSGEVRLVHVRSGKPVLATLCHVRLCKFTLCQSIPCYSSYFRI